MSRSTKRIVFWILAPLILFLVLLIVLHTLATRIINHESVKNSIETAISKKLGGQFSYERADLSILPRPRVVIRGLNISIPENFSGSMKALYIYPELWPLITGRLRFTKVLFDQPDVRFSLHGKTGDRTAMETQAEPSPNRNLAIALEFVASSMPTVAILIEQGQLTFNQAGQRLFSLQEVESRIAFSSTESDVKGSSVVPPEERFRMTGNAQGIIREGARFPGPVRIDIRQFEVFPMKISISDTRIQTLDTQFSVTGSLEDYLTLTPKASLILGGSVGSDTVQWIRSATALPPELTVRAPVIVSQAHLSWSPHGTTRLEGKASVQSDIGFLFDVSWGLNHIIVKDLRIRDQTSQATMALDLDKKVLNVVFSGNLTQSTLNRLFKHENSQFGWVRGDFRARIVLNQPMESTIRGTIEGEQLVFPFQLKIPVTLNRFSLQAAARTVTLNPVILTLGTNRHTVRGTITASTDKWLMDLAFDGLEWESLQPLFVLNTPRDQSVAQEPRQEPVRADIRLSTRYFKAGRWTAAPARAEIWLRADGLRISLKEAVVCGVNLTGTVAITSAEISLDLKPSASHQNLKSSMACLAGEGNRITGTFALTGHLSATGPGPTLLNTLRGKVAVTAKDGRVFEDSVIVRILTYLNVTDLLRGSYPDPGKNGMPYNSFIIRGTIQKGVVLLDEAVLTSPVVDLAGHGSIKLLDRTMAVTVLAAPFTTADAVVKRIPLVGDILGNSLVTVPIRVSGSIEHPKIEPITPSAVAKGLIDMMNRTLGLPFEIIEPILSDRKTR